jgi:hypothetical protein
LNTGALSLSLGAGNSLRIEKKNQNEYIQKHYSFRLLRVRFTSCVKTKPKNKFSGIIPSFQGKHRLPLLRLMVESEIPCFWNQLVVRLRCWQIFPGVKSLEKLCHVNVIIHVFVRN